VRYRALFVGGPVDGQERVLSTALPEIRVRERASDDIVTYRLVFAFGEPRTLVYSLYSVEETMNRLWHRYSGEDHA